LQKIISGYIFSPAAFASAKAAGEPKKQPQISNTLPEICG
jgi:hypothetical protein